MALTETASRDPQVKRAALFFRGFFDSEVDFELFTIRAFYHSSFLPFELFTIRAIYHSSYLPFELFTIRAILDGEYSHLSFEGGKHVAGHGGSDPGPAILGPRSDARKLNICRAVDF